MSSGVDGTTTFNPGIAIIHVSTLWECWAPNRAPPPFAVRITIGSATCPFVMYRAFAIWFATMSQHTAKKSLNISSAIGRRPFIAAPIAAPMIACSLIGVSRTRSGPKRSKSPSVVLKTPPAAATSSPMKKTEGSRSIS